MFIRKARFEMTVGVLLRPQIRRYLTKAQWEYPELVWKEAQGWLESDFRVEGPDYLLTAMPNDLKSQFKNWEGI